MTTETIEFQAEARQLLRLMIHSIYSNKDVFLRELISNASDALDKVRLAAYQDKDLDADASDLHVELVPDAEGRTLTIRDNGIGMTRDEVVELIGTIAKSGTADLLARLKEAGDSEHAQELIGQFGIGFYSSFMVADRVELTTRKAGTGEGVHWTSDGEGSYTIEPVADAPQGTAVTLHLKASDAEDQMHDYADRTVLRRIVKTYSDFITWPIRMPAEAPAEDAAEAGDTIEDAAENSADDTAAQAAAPETLNSMKALWARPQKDVTEEEYAEFYRHVSHDWQEPLETIRLAAEGTFEYQALLFLPQIAPMDLYMRDARRGVQLYVRRVFIMDDCEALVPEYLRFVKGVVDAADLSLNVSREILQQDRQISAIRRRLVRKVLSTIGTMRDEQPEKYTTFWEQFGRALKEGLLSDPDNRETILGVSAFRSTHDSEGAETTSLAAYTERMREGQDAIYYMTGDSPAAIEASPHMEAFRDKGYEVLLLTDPVDEVWVDAVEGFDGTPFRSIAKGQVDLQTDEEKEQAEERKTEFAGLCEWMAGVLGDDVKEVRLSSRLTTSPAVLVGDEFDMTPTLEKMYRAMGQEPPKVQRILELNPSHPLVTGLRDAQSGEGAETNAELAETAELLHGMALLAEGGELGDPSRFVGLLAGRLQRTL
ncbi:molecular chaperone HtpG [Pseudonocardia ammonioxydans]|uniref:Chaperone protein HtpG n=1 Tax=Pseudonocardia ammonioxydans TaxID=260086 RepID=A0A1I4VMU4_PSUAM|nr:molecular chaperone HtpG [Pseudonocardia ammonioxydans]SFN02395.1 molecular chaperone HtpG [Pseudonocardia ammonioxydans]